MPAQHLAGQPLLDGGDADNPEVRGRIIVRSLLASFFIATCLGCGGCVSQALWMVSALLGDQEDGWCEIETGGVCLIRGCDPQRGRTRCDWGMCICTNGTCAGLDGICLERSQMKLAPAVGPAWVRKNIHYAYYAAPLAATFRTDVVAAVGAVTWQAFCGAAAPKPTHFQGRDSWSDTRGKMDLGCATAVGYAGVKLAFWHVAQPLTMLLAWYAYAPLMGWVQWTCGLLVAVREVCYLVIVALGVRFAPQFLLFQPFTEENSGLKVLFFASPHMFVLPCLDVSHDELVLALSLSTVMDLSAVVALLAGLGSVAGWSAMWPALGAGYMLALFALPLDLAGVVVHS